MGPHESNFFLYHATSKDTLALYFCLLGCRRALKDLRPGLDITSIQGGGASVRLAIGIASKLKELNLQLMQPAATSRTLLHHCDL